MDLLLVVVPQLRLNATPIQLRLIPLLPHQIPSYRLLRLLQPVARISINGSHSCFFFQLLLSFKPLQLAQLLSMPSLPLLQISSLSLGLEISLSSALLSELVVIPLSFKYLQRPYILV